MNDCYEYKGTTKKAKDFAVAHLNENPQNVNDHIGRLRKWVESMPHLKCPKDSKFLLRFLRVAKFNEKMAQERLDNFCTTRGYPQCFDYPKLDDPRVSEYLDKPIAVPLGKTDAGEMILLLRSNNWNPDTMSLQNYLTLTFMTLDMLVENEETQIYGIRFLIDHEGMTRNACVCASDEEVLKNVNRIWHESFPMRLNGEIIYNEPVILDDVLSMYTHFMDEETKSHMPRKINDLKTLMGLIPGVEKVLPKEYGGQAGPMSAIAERAKKQFKEYFKNGNPLASVRVEESKRPAGASYLSDHGEYKGPVLKKE